MSPDEQARAVVHLLDHASGYRLVLLQMLSFCASPRTAVELDAATIEYLAGRLTVLAPTSLRHWLVEAGGLDVQKSGDADDAVDLWSLSPGGKIALDDCSPSREIAQLLDEASPEHRRTYFDILGFCTTPRSREEIEQHLEGDPSICPPRIYPTMFVSALEDRGAIRWAGGWTTTALGKQICA
jgi:hypothetical protein